MPIRILRSSGTKAALIGVLVVSLFSFATPADGALPNTSTPKLKLNRTIRTSPFVGSSVSMKDNEGTAYVARDNSVWLANDNGRMIHEVNASTGALKRSIDRTKIRRCPTARRWGTRRQQPRPRPRPREPGL